MALFVKEDKNQRSDVTPNAAATPQSASNAVQTGAHVQAHLGQGSRGEGKLTFEGSVRIDGQIEGEVKAQDTVIVGESAMLTASIHANAVVVQGRIKGDIVARKRVELRAPAKITGNISTPCLVVNEGVVFEGNCSMGANDSRSERGDKRVAILAEERGTPGRRSSETAG